jgi:ATP-dependent DNA helicase RecQ
VFISEKDLAYRVKVSAATVAEYLKFLDQEGVLSYIPQSTLPKIIFMQDRVNQKYLEFNPENYQLLKDKALERLNAVIDFSNNNAVCRQVQLLMYFNEFNYSDCGHCDVCISKRPKNFEAVKDKITNALKEHALTLDNLRQQMTRNNDETWIRAFNELIDDGVIVENENLYSLRK